MVTRELKLLVEIIEQETTFAFATRCQNF